MNISKEEALKFFNGLKAKGIDYKCPICGCKEIHIENIEYHLTSIPNNGSQLDLKGLNVMPTLTCVCPTCGYVMSFARKLAIQ